MISKDNNRIIFYTDIWKVSRNTKILLYFQIRTYINEPNLVIKILIALHNKLLVLHSHMDDSSHGFTLCAVDDNIKDWKMNGSKLFNFQQEYNIIFYKDQYMWHSGLIL